jgi:hypothetical protein
MDAKELRFGNFVRTTITHTNIKITIDELLEIINEPSEHQLEPIPLTEDWLLKFGFEKITHAVRSYSYHICDKNERYWFFRISGQFGTITREITCVLSYEIKHVHQLQNLYFALTGKELKSAQIKKI